MKLNRRVTGPMVGVTVSLLLAGCGSGSTATGSSNSTPSSTSSSTSSSGSSSAATSSTGSSDGSAPTTSPADGGAGGSTAAPSGKSVSILWVQPLFTHPVHKIMQAGFTDACNEHHFTCTLVGNPSATNYDIAATVALAEAAMAKTKFDAIAVYDADPGIDSFIGKLGKEGYPVVTWHVIPAAGSVSGLKAAAAEDIPTAGANAADAIGAKINGAGTVAVSEGSSNTTENLMAKSFGDEMKKKYPNVKILDPVLEGFDPAAAQAKAVGVIQAHPDVVAAFSTTGGGPATWANAQRTAGKNLTIIGMDYTRQNLDLVKGGQVFGLVAQPLFAEAQKDVELAGALANGQSVTYGNVLPSPVITKDQLAPYYDILDKAGV